MGKNRILKYYNFKLSCGCDNILFAFTLAEVLITLAIIGVVAALTIPSVVRHYQELQIVTSVKKAYSQLAQAFNIATVENGPIGTWNWDDKEVIGKIITSHLKIIKDCGSSAGCFSPYYKTLNGTEASYSSLNSSSTYYKTRLADGFSFALSVRSGCSYKVGNTNRLSRICGDIYVDINGDKLPNQGGKDLFTFYITEKDGVIPMGTQDDLTGNPVEILCNINNQANGYNGKGCTAWVIAKENLDYLKKQVLW